MQPKVMLLNFKYRRSICISLFAAVVSFPRKSFYNFWCCIHWPLLKNNLTCAGEKANTSSKHVWSNTFYSGAGDFKRIRFQSSTFICRISCKFQQLSSVCSITAGLLHSQASSHNHSNTSDSYLHLFLNISKGKHYHGSHLWVAFYSGPLV